MAGLILAIVCITTARPAAQSVAAKETAFMVERALQRLPYYGVFDFLAFGVDRGSVTLQGYAYRIRWSTFYNIYTDDFLSRYAPGGAMSVRRDIRSFTRFPGMQPFGTYPIHIIVNNGRTTLLGVVDNESDKTVAGMRAREVSGVFEVENELVISKN